MFQDNSTPPPPPADDDNNQTQRSGQTTNDQQFDIPEEVKNHYPDLINLIIQSESMTRDERQYWFQTIPIMTPDQVVTLRNILFTEKKKLAQIDTKYQSDINNLSQQQMAAWQEQEVEQRRSMRKQSEDQDRAESAAATEDVLKELDEL